MSCDVTSYCQDGVGAFSNCLMINWFEAYLIFGELKPRADDRRQARMMVVFSGLYADKHVVEIRGERCHGRRGDCRCHRRFFAYRSPRNWYFHQYASTVYLDRHFVDPLKTKRRTCWLVILRKHRARQFDRGRFLERKRARARHDRTCTPVPWLEMKTNSTERVTLTWFAARLT